jgi:hypothetical protein
MDVPDELEQLSDPDLSRFFSQVEVSWPATVNVPQIEVVQRPHTAGRSSVLRASAGAHGAHLRRLPAPAAARQSTDTRPGVNTGQEHEDPPRRANAADPGVAVGWGLQSVAACWKAMHGLRWWLTHRPVLGSGGQLDRAFGWACSARLTSRLTFHPWLSRSYLASQPF